MRLAVLGDIHANAKALKGALAAVDLRGYDQLILLGDLLTYGTDIEETLDLVSARTKHGNAVLLRGNHDSFYQELLAGQVGYSAQLPAWIRESVEWTCARLPRLLWNSLEFCDEYLTGDVLFSHANPFGAGRWDYLNTAADHLGAVNALQNRAMRVGVFGHTHRTKWFRCEEGKGEFLPPGSGRLDIAAVHILNAGAIGQPRDRTDLNPYVLWLTRQAANDEFQFSYERYSYDTALHLQSLRRSDMSMEVVQRLCGFFAPGHGLGPPDETL